MLVMEWKKPAEGHLVQFTLFSSVNLCIKDIPHNDHCNSIYAVATSERKFVCFEYYVYCKNYYKKPKGVAYRERVAKITYKFAVIMPFEEYARHTEQLAWGLTTFWRMGYIGIQDILEEDHDNSIRHEEAKWVLLPNFRPVWVWWRLSKSESCTREKKLN